MLAAIKAQLAARRGADAETQACHHLEQQGLKLVVRNWRCPLGELDLVMCDHTTLVIVEVRARNHHSHGGALASVDQKKRSRLLRATLAFVQAHPQWQDAAIRFDVVSFQGLAPAHWLRNAFTTDDVA
jgi:putative endonuclease